jgi:hypothetical protein
MVAPPLELGAVNAMLALRLPAVALPMVGAPGTVTAPKAAELRPANDKKPKAVRKCLKPDFCIFMACSQVKQHIEKISMRIYLNDFSFEKHKFHIHTSHTIPPTPTLGRSA